PDARPEPTAARLTCEIPPEVVDGFIADYIRVFAEWLGIIQPFDLTTPVPMVARMWNSFEARQFPSGRDFAHLVCWVLGAVEWTAGFRPLTDGERRTYDAAQRLYDAIPNC